MDDPLNPSWGELSLTMEIWSMSKRQVEPYGVNIPSRKYKDNNAQNLAEQLTRMHKTLPNIYLEEIGKGQQC